MGVLRRFLDPFKSIQNQMIYLLNLILASPVASFCTTVFGSTIQVALEAFHGRLVVGGNGSSRISFRCDIQPRHCSSLYGNMEGGNRRCNAATVS